jgi:hypothetical protein
LSGGLDRVRLAIAMAVLLAGLIAASGAMPGHAVSLTQTA